MTKYTNKLITFISQSQDNFMTNMHVTAVAHTIKQVINQHSMVDVTDINNFYSDPDDMLHN